MTWEIIFKFFGLYLFGFSTIVWVAITYKLLFTPRNDYRKASKICGSFRKNVLKGCCSTFHNGYRDHSAKAGLAIDLKKNQWIEQGSLSDDSLDGLIRQ